MSGPRTVVHLSDLHFGREDRIIVDALLDRIRLAAPDLVAVSGDLTQRARRSQFERARAFLDAIPFPQLVVPGNHDVPLYNLWARLLNPLGGYRRHITSDLQPALMDSTLLVLGLDTTRPTTLKEGRIVDADVVRVAELIRQAPGDIVKILVGHHPFDAPEERRRDAIHSSVLAALTRAGVDVFLTGHLHVSYTGHTAHRYNIDGRSAIVVEAGTATSTRLREHANAFNLLRIDPAEIVVECHEWRGREFQTVDSQRFRRGEGGWRA
jgi:3',5'-cyclic AMP phosphodiesterase CpdA